MTVTDTLKKAKVRHPELRIGQIIYNALALHDKVDTLADWSKTQRYMRDFHGRLFYITDAELELALEEFIRR